MEHQNGFQPRPLSLSYEDFLDRGETIQNMIIDHYVVYDLIGMGSYGSVYRGMDDKTKKQVAVKLINMRQIKQDGNEVVRNIKLRLAESEPKLMYMCDSPYLLKCFNVYQNEDLKILIIEYCNGKTLQAEIDEKKRIPEKQAWIILKHIMNGLMVLHSHKIVHRDLKAQNIMSHNGTYKIIDFGFSKKLQIVKESAQIRNTSLGTITTMAPEVMGRKPYGLKADIWSVGIIFFQMIYGQYPYDSTSAPQMYREIQVKKLFNKEQPFTFNKYTPSKEAYDFLRTTVVVQTDKRSDWRKVAEYPNIKNVQEISQRFIAQCDVVPDKDLDYNQALEEERPNVQFNRESIEITKIVKIEEQNKVPEPPKKQENRNKEERSPKKQEEKSPKKQEEKKGSQTNQKDKDQGNSAKKKMKYDLSENIRQEKEEKARREKEKAEREKKLIEELERQRKEKAQKRPTRGLNKEEIRLKEKQIDKQQDQEYIWTEQAHLQCLKTRFVYRQIIFTLGVSNDKNFHDRSFIEFFYLLSARCFNNMSPIRDEIDERKRLGKDIKIINNLNEQVKELYKQVHGKFMQFSKALTNKENEKTSMIKDWFSKKLSKDSFKEKDRFLTGVEKLQYTKEEQIIYTATYYDEHIKSEVKKESIQKRMRNYSQIMSVKLNELRNKGLTFDDFVKRILDYQ